MTKHVPTLQLAPAAISTLTFRKNSAAASGNTVLMNIPDPSSKPATRVRRGMMLTYQWKCFTPTYSAGALRMVEIEIRIAQPVVNLRQNGFQHPGQVSRLDIADVAKTGHVAARVNGSAERGWRGIEFQGNEVVGEKHHSLLVLNFFLQALAEHALAIFVVMVQGLLEALAHLM